MFRKILVIVAVAGVASVALFVGTAMKRNADIKKLVGAMPLERKNRADDDC
jgi:hypothetical protein